MSDENPEGALTEELVSSLADLDLRTEAGRAAARVRLNPKGVKAADLRAIRAADETAALDPNDPASIAAFVRKRLAK